MKSLHAVYQEHAVQFDRDRDKRLFEKGWLHRFAAILPDGGRVLDLGCGSGRPMADHLLGLGFDLTGVDFAGRMIDLARERFPDARWIEADMREFDLEERFDGVLGWNSFFHLTATEQRQVLPRMAAHLVDGGALLLSVGPSAGEAWGQVAGQPVYHASLSIEEYEAILNRFGMQSVDFVPEDPECNGHSVLLAQKG
ncbi:class I SAM-dependent methyltransferase [Alisedimentitalea sp. MJ-SS2]|uniref:class I SAM-dependent methyltransferase n=1 Tax=Aliisedimentitalea sp. MJ-SS2 TaxID=3049795 RepID=UPI00290E4332|nr:class I SAM-dependent methyltransferase [Alisedimentitalea sp. MJ-SS2]MDU8926361.1 class I SAM-dependent methyltransferase [Alisedimentitalea sp. MJ-SS2]